MARDKGQMPLFSPSDFFTSEYLLPPIWMNIHFPEFEILLVVFLTTAGKEIVVTVFVGSPVSIVDMLCRR